MAWRVPLRSTLPESRLLSHSLSFMVVLVSHALRSATELVVYFLIIMVHLNITVVQPSVEQHYHAHGLSCRADSPRSLIRSDAKGDRMSAPFLRRGVALDMRPMSPLRRGVALGHGARGAAGYEAVADEF